MTTKGNAGYLRIVEGGTRHGLRRFTRARRIPPRVPPMARRQPDRRAEGRGRAGPAHLPGPRHPRETYRLAETDARRRLGRTVLAQGVWRARRQLYAAGDLRRGIFP